MPWESGILNGLSHMLDILPPDNLGHRMKIDDTGFGVPSRHWLYRIRGHYTNGLLLFVKNFKVQSNLYVVDSWTESDRFRGQVFIFHTPEELKSKLAELKLPVPSGYGKDCKEMQGYIDHSDPLCFLKSVFDRNYGYRELVAIDEIGKYMRQS